MSGREAERDQQQLHTPAAAKLSGQGLRNSDDDGDDSDDDKSEKVATISQESLREKESLILRELSATLHTLQNLTSVLEDIVDMTTPVESPQDASIGRKGNEKIKNSIALQQQQLLEELKKWRYLLPGTTSQETINPNVSTT